MPYSRPPSLSSADWTVLGGFTLDVDSLIGTATTALAVSFYDDRALPPPGTFVEACYYVVEYLEVGRTAGLEQIAIKKGPTQPGESSFAIYTITGNYSEFILQHEDFFDAAAGISGPLYTFPTNGKLKIPSESTITIDGHQSHQGAQEVFAWTPSGGGGGGGGGVLPPGPCPDPPPWPYEAPAVGIGQGDVMTLRHRKP